MRTRPVVIAAALLACVACQPAAPPALPPAPARAEPVAGEAALLSITLAPEARQRLGLATVVVARRAAAPARLAIGEVVNAPLGAAVLPAAAGSDFSGLAARQAAADGELARARAALTLAERAYGRATALLREDAGSDRARDEAAAQRAAAAAAVAAARAQRDLLGPDPASLRRATSFWVRVPVSVTDVARVAPGMPASVSVPGAAASARPAVPVEAVPTADPVAGTTDIYYGFDNRDLVYRPGQRVAVSLPLRGVVEGIAVPPAAVVTDIHGGEWVYREPVAGAYRRQRVEVAGRDGGWLVVTRGLEAGDAVVVAGAAELFGYEFGTGR
mgnify:CR=1 FL=1